MRPTNEIRSAERGDRPAPAATYGQGVLRPQPRATDADPIGTGPFHEILVCLDGSPAGETALPVALAVARAFGARLHLLRVVESSPPSLLASPMDALDWEMARTEARDYLDGLERRLADSRVPLVGAVTQGVAAEQVLRYARERRIDLIALATHGEKGVTEWKLAGTAEKVASRPGTSLLLVPSTWSAKSSAADARLRRILVPLDASPLAECVVPALLPIARLHGSVVILAHVVPVPRLLHASTPSPEDLDLVRRLTDRNARVARDYVARMKHCFRSEDVSCREVVETGEDVRQTLHDIAEREEADLVVLSSHGSTGNQRHGYGGVAWQLICDAERPLLVVRGIRAPIDDHEASSARSAQPLRGLFSNPAR